MTEEDVQVAAFIVAVGTPAGIFLGHAALYVARLVLRAG